WAIQGEHDMHEELGQLAGLACPGGGWGYAPGQQPHLEPTCLALLALAREPDRHAAAIAAGKTWLAPCAAGDRTYRPGRGRREAAWPTALVIYTLAQLGEALPSLEGSARALLALRGLAQDMSGEKDVNDIDGTIIGWPWAEGTFSWVEPTSWAILALR